MLLEVADGPLGDGTWLPTCYHLQFGSFAALVVNNLKVNSVASFVESGHDSIGGIETVAVLAILEGFN